MSSLVLALMGAATSYLRNRLSSNSTKESGEGNNGDLPLCEICVTCSTAKGTGESGEYVSRGGGKRLQTNVPQNRRACIWSNNEQDLLDRTTEDVDDDEKNDDNSDEEGWRNSKKMLLRCRGREGMLCNTEIDMDLLIPFPDPLLKTEPLDLFQEGHRVLCDLEDNRSALVERRLARASSAWSIWSV